MPPVDPNAPTPPAGTIAPAISPTGEAILPAKYLPVAMGIATLPGALAGSFKAADIYPQAQMWLGIASMVLWLILGAISPGLRKAAPTAALLLALSLTLWAPPARAFDTNMGLSVPMTRIRLLDPAGSGKPVVEGLAAGAGYAVGLGFLPMSFAPGSALGGTHGTTWDMLGLGAVAFATFPADGPQLAVGAQLCTASGLLCAGFGSDLLANLNGQMSGLLAGKVGRQNLFALLTINIGLGVGDPIHPDTGLPKANAFSLTPSLPADPPTSKPST